MSGTRSARWFASSILAGILPSIAAAHPGPGIVVDRQENVYFVDFTHDRVMRVPGGGEGQAAVFVDGTKDARFSVPHHLVIGQDDAIFVASDRDGQIWRLKPDAEPEQVYPPPGWHGINFIGSGGDAFTVDDRGNLYGVNSRQGLFMQILRIDQKGLITSLAGGSIGHADGKGTDARFAEPVMMAMVCAPTANGASAGTLFVADGTSVRQVTPDGTVSTLAGSSQPGFADGPASEARFSWVSGLNWDRHGNLLAADHGNKRIRVITREGDVTSITIRPPEGGRTQSERAPIEPVGVAMGPSGDYYVLDYPVGDAPRVCRVKADGTAKVIAALSPARAP